MGRDVPPVVYWGQDRRARAPQAAPAGRQFVLAVLLLVATTGAVVALALAVRDDGALDRTRLAAVLWTGCAALALVAGFVSCLRWRMVGDASSLWTGTALLLYAGMVLTLDVAPFVDPSMQSSALLRHLDPALMLTTIGLFVVAVVLPPIDTRVSVIRVVATVALSIAALTALDALLVDLHTFGHTMPPQVDVGELVKHDISYVVILILAVIAVARGLHARSWLWTWIGLMMLGLVDARILSSFAHRADDLWVIGGLVVRVLALVFAVIGVSEELKVAFVSERANLFDSRVAAETTAARLRAQEYDRAERAHEARSAMLAIQTAVRGLEVSYDDLGPSDREVLREGLESEISILRRLFDPEPEQITGLRRPFDVRSTITPIVAFQRLNGLDVDVDVPHGLFAVGRASEVAQVVQTLLDNARRHARGARVVVRGERQGMTVVLRVEDDGPGVADVDHERIFRRGVSGRSGSGLGLYVARRLLRDQGGDIFVEDRPGGGAAFVMRLAAPSGVPRPRASAHAVHDGDQVRRLVDVEAFGSERGHE